MFGALLVCVGELLLGTYNDAEELGTTWWYEIRARCVLPCFVLEINGPIMIYDSLLLS